jgi:hypothetical protein
VRVDAERLGTQLSVLAARGRTVLARHLVAAVAVSATRGATADGIESVAAGIAGTCPDLGRAGEPRWSPADVLRVVRDRPDLLVPVVRDRAPVPGPDRGGHGRAVPGLRAGRLDRGIERGLDRGIDR